MEKESERERDEWTNAHNKDDDCQNAITTEMKSVHRHRQYQRMSIANSYKNSIEMPGMSELHVKLTNKRKKITV